MPSLSSIIASQLGLGSLPQATMPVAAQGVGAAEAKNSAVLNGELAAQKGARSEMLSQPAGVLNSKQRQEMRRAQPVPVPLAAPTGMTPPDGSQMGKSTNSLGIKASAPKVQRAKDIAKELARDPDYAVQFKDQIKAVNGADPEPAIRAAEEILQFWGNNPSSITTGQARTGSKTKKRES